METSSLSRVDMWQVSDESMVVEVATVAPKPAGETNEPFQLTEVGTIFSAQSLKAQEAGRRASGRKIRLLLQVPIALAA